jgi:hypothetical protein
MNIAEPIAMDGNTIRIMRHKNGFEIEMRDPKIDEQNRKAKGGRWQNPEVSYVFKTFKELQDFLTANLEKALPVPKPDEYATSFAEAATEEDDD